MDFSSLANLKLFWPSLRTEDDDPASAEADNTQGSQRSVAQLMINRPKAMNALNSDVLKELGQALDALSTHQDLRCLIITGEGTRAFVAGADIAEMAEYSPEQALAFSKLGHDVFLTLETFPTPVLAAVNGYALGGGCELALACDIIYASQKAKFGQPEVNLGLIPGFGGSVRLPRKIGRAAACEWIFTGEMVSAEHAHRLGLVHEVTAPEALMERVHTMAALIAKRGPVAVRAAKKAIDQGLGGTFADALGLEQQFFSEVFSSEDMREGTRAFLEKRDPQFKGV